MVASRSSSLAAGLADFALYVTMASLPFRLLALGASSLVLGLVPFLYAIPYAATAWAAGRGSDRFDRSRSTRAGATGAAVGAIAMTVAPGVGWILATVPLLGFSLAFYWPALQATVADAAGADLSGGVGRFNIGWSSGKALGFLTGGLLTANVGAAAGSGVAVVAFLMVALILRPRRTAAVAPAPADLETPGPQGFREVAWLANGAGFGLVATINHHFPVVMTARGLGADRFGLLMGTIFLAQVGAFWFLARTTPAWSYRAGLFRFALLGAAVVALAIPWLPFWLLVALAPVLGLGLGFFYNSSIFYSVHGSTRRGGHAGMHETVLGLASAGIPFVGGVAASLGAGMRAPFLVTGLALVLVWAWSWPRLRPRPTLAG